MSRGWRTLFAAFIFAYPAGNEPKLPPELSALYQSIDQLQKKSEANSQDTSLLLQLADQASKGGKFQLAESAYQSLIAKEPRSIPPLVGLARLLRKQYRFDELASVIEKIRISKADDRAGRILSACLALDRMDFKRARDEYESVSKAEPTNPEALYGLALVAYYEDRIDEAERFVASCLKGNPKFASAWILQSNLHRDRQENEKYSECVKRAVAADPFDDVARVSLGFLLMREEKKLNEGYEQLRIALQLNPYSSAHSSIGNGWSNRMYPAIVIPLKGSKAKQEFLAMMKKAEELLDQNQLDDADRALSDALKLLPSHVPALCAKGIIQYHRKNFDEALRWFFDALENDPDYGLAHYGIGESLARKSDRINIQLPEIEKQFAAIDFPEPSSLRDVFVNYASLDAEMQKLIRISVQPLKKYLPLLKENDSKHHIFPIHRFVWQVEGNAYMKGTRTFDGRLWDDIKGNGGKNSTSGIEKQRVAKFRRFNVVAHEFAHQVHQFLPQDLKDEISELYTEAKEGRKTLDYYADSNEMEYFAQGVEAYVSEVKLADQKLTSGHTRSELQHRDPKLFQFIEKLAQVEK